MKQLDFSQPYLSIVIPAYNEENTLRRVVMRVLEVPGLREVIVVNDGSSDQTGAIADTFAGRDVRV